MSPAPSLPRRVVRRSRNAFATARNVAPFAHPVPVGLRLALRPRLRLLCYPKRPFPWQVLYKICAVNGYQIVTDPKDRYDMAIRLGAGDDWDLPDQARVLNRFCTDISKRHVADVFARVFGYGLAVDPLSHHGPMVEKSDANYKHDGRILEGPLKADEVAPDRVYQRLVNTAQGAEAVDLRTPLYGGRVPFVYEKRRPLERRFQSRNNSVHIRETSEIYTTAELAALRRFAAEMNLDYGELDVLRDADGRIYVVDVANTPSGPSTDLGITPGDAKAAVQRLSREFAALADASFDPKERRPSHRNAGS